MIRVPLAAVPSQTLAIVLRGQACEISLRQNGANLYFSLKVAQREIVTTKLARNKQRLLLSSRYYGFAGDFIFVDTQGSLQPRFTGLVSRYRLFYLAPADL